MQGHGLIARAIPAALLALVTALTPQLATALVLTPGAVARGFSLSTFATDFPSSFGVGPLGIEFTSSGGVMVTDYTGRVRVFPTHADGQSAAVIPTVDYTARDANGLAKVGNRIFMAQENAGKLIEVNEDGTFKQEIVADIPGAIDVVANPADGTLFVSALAPHDTIWHVDPITKTKSLFLSNVPDADGLSMSADGSILYVAVRQGPNPGVKGYRVSDGALVLDTSIAHPDGTAIGFGALDGFLYSNNIDGTLIEIDLATADLTMLATGGSRGDFVAVDPTNNSLLITQSTTVLRLTAPAGGGFGGGTLPEPWTVALLGLGLAGFGVGRRRRRRD